MSLAFVLRGWIAAAVVGSVSQLGIGAAWARPPSSKASSRRASPVDEARAAAHERRLDATITARKEAYQKSGDPRLLFELGEIHLRSGRTVEAQRFYNAYLAHEPAAKDRRAAEERLREIEVALALGAPPTKAPGPPQLATQGAVASAVTPATTPPPLEVGASPPPPAEPPSKPREEPLAAAVPTPSPSASPQQPAPLPQQPLPQPPLPQQPPTSPPSSLPPSPALPAPSTIVAAAAPASPTAGIDRGADLPVPRSVPVVGAALTGSLVVGALVGGTMANNTYDRLHGTCAMTDAGCSPERIDGLRSLARIANALWIAAAVAGTGTAIVVFVDANAAGMSKTWSF